MLAQGTVRSRVSSPEGLSPTLHRLPRWKHAEILQNSAFTSHVTYLQCSRAAQHLPAEEAPGCALRGCLQRPARCPAPRTVLSGPTDGGAPRDRGWTKLHGRTCTAVCELLQGARGKARAAWAGREWESSPALLLTGVRADRLHSGASRPRAPAAKEVTQARSPWPW